jgi:peptidoglycan/xylan/chitin deacetylase (PgdA/CDA1 family)
MYHFLVFVKEFPRKINLLDKMACFTNFLGMQRTSKKSLISLITIFNLIACVIVGFGIYSFFQSLSQPKNNELPQSQNSDNTTKKDSSIPIKKETNAQKEEPKVQKKSYSATPDLKKIYLDIPVLTYHHIDTIPAGFENDSIAVGLRVSPAAFDAQMKTLKDKGYKSLHIDEYEEITLGLKPAPKNPVLITIDDGFIDASSQALPILKKYGQIGNFAIITGVLGTREYMTLDQLKEIQKTGMGIMNHTHLHCSLAERITQNGQRVYLPNSGIEDVEPCPSFTFGGTLSKGQVEFEMADAKKFLDKELGIDVRSIVYPFGNYNETTPAIALKTGHNFGFTTKDSVAPFKPETTLFELPRISVGGQQTAELKGFFVGI